MSDLISRQDAIDVLLENIVEYDCSMDEYDNGVAAGYIFAVHDIQNIPSADRPKGECTGCKYIGTYDTEFPCANCTRKTKDYYCGADMRGGKNESVDGKR